MIKIKVWLGFSLAALLLSSQAVATLYFGGNVNEVIVTVGGGSVGGDTTTTLYFSGLCDDCKGILDDGFFEPVTGTLVLQNYKFFNDLDTSNFVSFTYDGSSLVDEFTVYPLDIINLLGNFAPGGSLNSQYFSLTWNKQDQNPPPCPGFSNCEFFVASNGDWLLGLDDEGKRGQFSTPEPTTLALFGFGIAGMGYLRRKRLIA